MKPPSTDLFDLIKSLSKSEKRYIRIQCAGQGMVYEQLFDLILGLKTYDEVQLKKRHSELPFMGYLPVAKKNLLNFILESLDRYRKKDWEDRLEKKAIYAKILWKKGLKAQARKQLYKARKEAMKNELFLPQLRLIALEKQFLETNLEEKTTRSLFEAEQDCLEKLHNINKYWWLTTQISLFQLEYQKLRDEKTKNKLETLFQHPFLQDSSSAITFQSKLYFFSG